MLPVVGSDVRGVQTIASARGVTPAQVVLRWHVEHRVVVIPKSATPERIRANLAIGGFSLTAEEVARLEEPYTPHEVAGFR